MAEKAIRDAEFWRFKARALLWSPGEHDGDFGDQQILELCARDAYDMHICGVEQTRRASDPVEAETRPGAAITMKHPLSAVDLGEPTDLDAWQRCIAEATRVLDDWPDEAEKARDRFKRLWHRVMLAGRDIPGHRVLTDHSAAALCCATSALAGARYQGDEPALVYFHLGPVQSFISASRRTHDLWVGSFTVGYLTMAAVNAIARCEGPDAPIYPDLSELPIALYQLGLERDKGMDPAKAARLRSSVSNKFLAIVAKSRVKHAVAAAHAAVQEQWEGLAGAAWQTLSRAWARMDEEWPVPSKDIFDEQIAGHIEFDAVVQPWPVTRGELDRLLASFDLTRSELLQLFDDEATAVGAAYGDLYNLCHRVMAAHRKTVFPPARTGDERPKCSQCGAREQIAPSLRAVDRPLDRHRDWLVELGRALSEKDSRDTTRQSYQLARGEGLCAVCWIKRLAPEQVFGDPSRLGIDWSIPSDRKFLRFPGVVTIAAAPFRYRLLVPSPDLRDDETSNAGELAAALTAWSGAVDTLLEEKLLDFTPPENLLAGLRARHRPFVDIEHAVAKHDGEWLYDSNYEPLTAWRNHFSGDPTAPEETQCFARPLGTARNALTRVRQLAGGIAPSPYYAILVIDGDNMGDWLTGRHNLMPTLGELSDCVPREYRDRRRPLFPALHREVSRRLAHLAQDLHHVVDHYLGRMVYCGGDDAMAFLPLATLLPCLRAVADRMRHWLGERVTFSAGVAIDHMRSPLSRALERARRAEVQSKDRGRDCFTINVAKRSGAPVAFTLPWRASRLPRQSGAPGDLDVVSTLIELLASDSTPGEEEDNRQGRLLRMDVVYRLEQEFALLDAQTVTLHAASTDESAGDLRQLLRNRLATELGGSSDRVNAALESASGSPSPSTSEQFMHLFDALATRANPAVSMSDMLSVLLFLRFLCREQHGIEFGPLLEDLGEPQLEVGS